jgi:hypothetical protein
MSRFLITPEFFFCKNQSTNQLSQFLTEPNYVYFQPSHSREKKLKTTNLNNQTKPDALAFRFLKIKRVKSSSKISNLVLAGKMILTLL